MCLICIDLDRMTMKSREARRALGEMRSKLDPAHVRDVEVKMREAEAREAQEAQTDTPPGSG